MGEYVTAEQNEELTAHGHKLKQEIYVREVSPFKTPFNEDEEFNLVNMCIKGFYMPQNTSLMK